MKLKLSKKNKGFALLFSVLISSLLLTIGLSIFSVALKELSISTAARQSIHAFFAADSGREYVLYRDLKDGNILIFDTETEYGDTIYSSDFSESDDSLGGPNFVANIKKEWFDSTKNKIKTTVVSRGYDSDNDDRVERAIEQTY